MLRSLAACVASAVLGISLTAYAIFACCPGEGWSRPPVVMSDLQDVLTSGYE
jgi:hypothetical protein